MISRLVEIVPGGLSVRHSRHIEKGHLRLTAVLEFVNYILIDAIVLSLYLAEQAAAVLGDGGVLHVLRIGEADKLGRTRSSRVIGIDEGGVIYIVLVLAHYYPAGFLGDFLTHEDVELVGSITLDGEAAVFDKIEFHIVDIECGRSCKGLDDGSGARYGDVIDLAYAEVAAYTLIIVTGSEFLDSAVTVDDGEHVSALGRAGSVVNAVKQGKRIAVGIFQENEGLRFLTHRGHIGIRIHIYPALHSLLEYIDFQPEGLRCARVERVAVIVVQFEGSNCRGESKGALGIGVGISESVDLVGSELALHPVGAGGVLLESCLVGLDYGLVEAYEIGGLALLGQTAGKILLILRLDGRAFAVAEFICTEVGQGCRKYHNVGIPLYIGIGVNGNLGRNRLDISAVSSEWHIGVNPGGIAGLIPALDLVPFESPYACTLGCQHIADCRLVCEAAHRHFQLTLSIEVQG